MVCAGFETDFASIPRLLRIIISKLGRYNKAALLHDAIYQDAIAGKLIEFYLRATRYYWLVIYACEAIYLHWLVA